MTRVLDLAGQTFGSRTVLRRVGNTARGSSQWEVQCACGRVDTVMGKTLKDGNAKGCMKCRVTRVKSTALIGETFGTRTVIGYSETQGRRVVRCECGVVDDIDAHSLVSGRGCRHCYTAVKREDAMQRFNSGSLPGWYMNAIRHNAAMRSLPLEIDREVLKDLWISQEGRCALTGWPLEWSTWRNRKDTTASLDRIDSSQGYISGNVQWVHKVVNHAKMAASDKDFIEMCRAVARQADGL